MAQTGFTPIQLYSSSTAAAVPIAGNLAAGELAINTVDEKLYFKNSAGAVKLLAANITPVANGGTGTATPGLVQGANITITGTWPNQTIAAAAPGTGTVTSVAGTGSANGLTLSGTVTSSGNITLGGSVTSLTTTNFTVAEESGKLVIKYQGTVVASFSSAGALIAKDNITAYGTP
jgi:hypothetical protein